MAGSTKRPLKAILRPDAFGKTVHSRIYYATLDLRRTVARAWRRVALVIYEWIWP